ncbi:suppressor of variegation 3-9 isoform X2 [Nomia melanderi]|nr:histone-lysine N-methyltransferase SUV39H2-like isoform X2 [Nomia melanderi]
MFYTCGKRPASPGNTQPSMKQAKYEQNFNSLEDASSDKTVDTYLSNNNASFSCEDNTQVTSRNSIRSTQYSENKKETSTERTRLNKLNSSDNTNFNVKSGSYFEKLQLKYNIDNFKLKELKIVLKDVKHDKKHKINLPSSENDLWEVEQILGKKQQGDQLLYLIKWKNWGNEYNTWEPESNLINCSDMLEEFKRNRLKLLTTFQKKANFYPTKQDIEKFLKELAYKGKTITSISVNEDTLFTSMSNFLRQKYIKNTRYEFVRDGILCMLISDLRREQLKSLLLWEKEMNVVTKGKPLIRVENKVDLEKAPQNFYYIDDYLPGAGVIIPDDPPIGCECRTCNSKTECCFGQYGGYCPYTITCKIRVQPGTPIYECNKRCTCDMSCINRVVQRGTEMKLCIFRTANGRGWGVKTLESIKKGSFVTQYVGEVITSEEAEKRGKEYDAAGRTYLFDLDYNETEGQCPYTVDAAVYGNISHFINHSCDPNLAVYAVWIDCLDPNLPKLALFATRDIKKNEEITFDYTCQISGNSETLKEDILVKDNVNTGITESQDKFEIRPETPMSDSSYSKTLCKCGARNCRQYLF